MITNIHIFAKPYVRGFLAIVLGMLVCLAQADKNLSQEKNVVSNAEVRERIAAIIGGALRRSEFVLEDGTRISQRALPSSEEDEEIKRYGDAAVPVLAEYLDAEDSREKTLAMRLLGNIGSESIVEPLKKVVLKDPSPDMRKLALNWLTQAPWEKAYSIIRKAAETDKNRGVRKLASGLLVLYAPK